MRRPVLVLLVVAACTPLMLVAGLFAAARFTWMDRMTLGLPEGWRKSVAALAMNNAGYGKQASVRIDRVIRLDPENGDAWSRRCSADGSENASGAKVKLDHCKKALDLQYSVGNLVGVGWAQERLQDYCAAEESFTRANTLVNASYTYVLRDLGRAALACGHTGASVASFEVAEDKDAKDLNADTEDDDRDEDRDTLRLDREWLVVANLANKDAKRAAVACSRAHPGWKSCDCRVEGDDVKCSEGR